MPVAAQQDLEEIIVTAAKREMALQDVPIAVTAVSGEELPVIQIGSLEDIQFLVPNMAFGCDFNFAKPAMSAISGGSGS
jgi:iron complex outermembrane receptor protein